MGEGARLIVLGVGRGVSVGKGKGGRREGGRGEVILRCLLELFVRRGAGMRWFLGGGEGVWLVRLERRARWGGGLCLELLDGDGEREMGNGEREMGDGERGKREGGELGL